MSKRIAWLAAAGLSVMAAAMGLWSYNEANRPMFLRGENEAQEQGRPPVDGDYWAIRVGYGGDPHNLRFEPRWLLHSKEQDARIASGVPAGMKDYRKPAGSPLSLDPNAFTLLGPQPLAGEGFGAGNNAVRTNVVLGDPDLQPGDARLEWARSRRHGRSGARVGRRRPPRRSALIRSLPRRGRQQIAPSAQPVHRACDQAATPVAGRC